jgi:hypothetical protein
MSTYTDRKGRLRLRCRLTLGLGLSAAVLVFGAAGALADGKASFGNLQAHAQLASFEPQHRMVSTTDLADERAKGFTAGMTSAPDDAGKVAVILWDDAWSELQRRARSASAGATVGSNTGSSLVGSSGSQAN